MASNSDNPADPFKKALAEATKGMANNPELNVNYTVDPSGISGDSIRLTNKSKNGPRRSLNSPRHFRCSCSISSLP